MDLWGLGVLLSGARHLGTHKINAQVTSDLKEKQSEVQHVLEFESIQINGYFDSVKAM